MDDDHYILEFIRIGNQVKVTACDPETGIEAIIMGPSRAPRKYLSDVAVKKLEYILKKTDVPPLELGDDEP